MAGARFVEELVRRDRARAFDVTVFGDERGGSYNRIMLSGVLGRHRAADDIVTHPEAWYGERELTLRSETPVARIDRDRRVVVCADGSETPYDALVLATGSAPFVPPIEGIAGRDVYVFRTLADCASIQSVARTGSRAIVLGGGLLGLEAASGLRALGAEVALVHLMPTLMEVQLDADGGRALQAKMELLGIDVRTGARSERVVRDAGGAVAGLELAGGTVLEADFIVVCCGIVPRAGLAREAGLEMGRGVVVDDGLRTSDDRIYAVGEVVTHRGTTYGLVEPIWEQCRVLAERLAGGTARYAGSTVGTRLKVAGVNVVALGARERSAGDECIATHGADGSYRKALARDGKLIGAQVVGDPIAAAMFARAFATGVPLPATLAALVFGVEASTSRSGVTAPQSLESERICQCNDVSKATILDAIEKGARDVAAIGEATLAGTGCGTCQTDLAVLVRSSAKSA
jgi:nitrite reductase (NADH) large subunit